MSEIMLTYAAALAAVDIYGLPDVSPATARWFRQSASMLADYLGGDRPVRIIEPADIAGWQYAELRRGVSPITVNSYLRAVKTLLARLVKRGVIPGNPAAAVRFLSEPPPRPKAIAEADYLAMRRAAEHPRDRALIDMLWGSGCRLGGLLSARVDMMDYWQSGRRHCFAFLVSEKGAKQRWIYAGREPLQGIGIYEYLQVRPDSEDRALFLTLNKPHKAISGPTVEGVIRKLRRLAKIPSKRPANIHGFRHAFAIRLLDEGIPLDTVSKWLGHSSSSFTAEVYVVRSESALRDRYFRPGRY